MSNGFSFPPHGKAGWGEPTESATNAPALELFSRLSPEGQRSLEEQGLREAGPRELTQRVASLERAHEHDVDHMTAVSLDVTRLQDEFRIVCESLRAEIDQLRDELRTARAA